MASLTGGTPEEASVSPDVNGEGNADDIVRPDSIADQNAGEEAAGPDNGSSASGDAASGNAEPSGDTSINTDTAESVVPSLQDGSGKPDRGVYDHTEEVPCLLGKDAIADTTVSENVPDDKADQAPVSLHDLPNPSIIAVSVPTATEDPGFGAELKKIMDSQKESLSDTQNISSKIGMVANDTERLVKEISGISFKYEQLTAELEFISSTAHSKSSKAFLAISSVVLVLLVISQIYLFLSMTRIQRQNTAGSAVLENIGSINKKMSDIDKNLAKALEKPAQQEQVQANPAAVVHADTGSKEGSSANSLSVLERLNKLRNGLPEKRLIRKETGDWFVYNKKSQECISDVEVIEALNQAYRKIGRQLEPNIPMPAHNALCILKPNGKGGTDVVMTKEFLP